MSKINKLPSCYMGVGDAKDSYDKHLDQFVEVNDQRALGIGGILWKVAKILLMVVRMPVFVVLYFLRAPVMMVSSVLYLPLFMLALFAWYAFPEKPQMWGGFGVISLLSFVLMYVYDLVLSWLSPHELVRTL